jgi:cephalosporin hydroxylase
MSEYATFKKECECEINRMEENEELQKITAKWMSAVTSEKYSYHFESLGRPIIQYPQDIVAMQELIWVVKPDLIIETGIAHGGSLIMNASMLSVLEYCEAQQSRNTVDPTNPKRKVLGIDIDIRSHNRNAIESHPMASRIQLIEG